MSVLSGQSIRKANIIKPFREKYKDLNGVSGGLSSATYDVALDCDVYLPPGGFCLASTIEHFTMPLNVDAVVHDKSTYARKGLSVFNTYLDPGWKGFLTLELSNRGPHVISLQKGDVIAQIRFGWLDEPAEQPYAGKYQDQERGPQEAR